MYWKKGKIIVLLTGILFLTAGCSSNTNYSSEVLEKNKIYYGKNATHEVIEVNSHTSWTIKSDKKDDTNYSVVTVSETGEEIAGYPVIKLVAEEVNGDIESSFAKKEGRDFIVVNDEESVYFRSVADENKHEIEEDLENTDNPNQHIMSISNYVFNES